MVVRVLGLLTDPCGCSRVLAGLDRPEFLHPFLAGGRADGGVELLMPGPVDGAGRWSVAARGGGAQREKSRGGTPHVPAGGRLVRRHEVPPLVALVHLVRHVQEYHQGHNVDHGRHKPGLLIEGDKLVPGGERRCGGDVKGRRGGGGGRGDGSAGAGDGGRLDRPLVLGEDGGGGGRVVHGAVKIIPDGRHFLLLEVLGCEREKTEMLSL